MGHLAGQQNFLASLLVSLGRFEALDLETDDDQRDEAGVDRIEQDADYFLPFIKSLQKLDD